MAQKICAEMNLALRAVVSAHRAACILSEREMLPG
jgi:hypothetical protein